MDKEKRSVHARTYTEQDKKILSEAIKNSEAYQKYLENLREKNRLIKEARMKDE